MMRALISTGLSWGTPSSQIIDRPPCWEPSEPSLIIGIKAPRCGQQLHLSGPVSFPATFKCHLSLRQQRMIHNVWWLSLSMLSVFRVCPGVSGARGASHKPHSLADTSGCPTSANPSTRAANQLRWISWLTMPELNGEGKSWLNVTDT